MLRARLHFLLASPSPISQSTRERKREIKREREREKEGGRERDREREKEEESKKEGERDVEYGCLIFLTRMMGALAPLSYLVIYNPITN
jgi:hypothetical protein